MLYIYMLFFYNWWNTGAKSILLNNLLLVCLKKIIRFIGSSTFLYHYKTTLCIVWLFTWLFTIGERIFLLSVLIHQYLYFLFVWPPRSWNCSGISSYALFLLLPSWWELSILILTALNFIGHQLTHKQYFDYLLEFI